MNKTTARNAILVIIGIGLVAWGVHLYDARQRAVSIANDPNPCARPELASKIMASVSKIQTNNGVALQVTNMNDVTTTGWQPERKFMECHATFTMSNGTHTAGTYTEKMNIAGQPITQFKPDMP